MEERHYLTVGEVASEMRVIPLTVYRWISDGRLDAVRLGGGNGPLRIPAGALDEFVQPARKASNAVVEQA